MTDVSGEGLGSLLIVSDLGLVAEALSAALALRGYTVEVRSWPRSDLGQSGLGLLVTDVDPGPGLGRVLALGHGGRRWVCVTGTRRGPIWGALLDAGFHDVLSSDMSLDAIDVVLRAAARGSETIDPRRRQELVRAWRELEPELRDLETRLGSLTPRELEVLQRLYAGTTVAEIARESAVSEATVRSQVQGVLRKLDVRSQLAAVAVYATAGGYRATSHA